MRVPASVRFVVRPIGALAFRTGRGRRETGASVYNGFVEGWINFGNWCIGKRGKGKRSHFNGEKRLQNNPFQGMYRMDEQADRRRKARALTEHELVRLLTSCPSKAPRRRVNDSTRQEQRKATRQGFRETPRRTDSDGSRTGFDLQNGGDDRTPQKRASWTLEVHDLSFGDVPFIKLRHTNEKSRQGSVLPMRSDVAAELRKWTAGKSPSDRVFYVSSRLLDILDRDLEAAGIPKVDDQGYVVHIHALRHSFGTHLSIAGVAPRTAQAATRHSSIDLTMNTYTDVRLLGTAEAVESLPSFDASDSSPDNDRTVAPNVAPNPGQQGPLESIH